MRILSPDTEFIQVAGIIDNMAMLGEKRSKRLVAQLKDKTGTVELCWFQGIHWIEKNISAGKPYLVFGRTSFFNGQAATYTS